MFKFKAAHAVAALLCAAAAPASAAVITQNGSVYDAPIRIDQFKSLYKLDSVTYSVTYGLSARIGNMEPRDVLLTYAGYTGGEDFGYTSFNSISNLPATTESFVGSTGSVAGEITSNLVRFVGDGKFQSNPLSSFFSTDGGAVSFMGLGTSATYVISYNFDDTVAAIPELGTWALMLAGFGMVGYGMRRKKTRVALA